MLHNICSRRPSTKGPAGRSELGKQAKVNSGGKGVRGPEGEEGQGKRRVGGGGRGHRSVRYMDGGAGQKCRDKFGICSTKDD